MIEVTNHYKDGIYLGASYRLREPDARIAGAPVHYVSLNVMSYVGAQDMIRALRLRQVGIMPALRAKVYAASWQSWVISVSVKYMASFYWATIRWLYKECRFFQELPAGARFSWRYFTPYDQLMRGVTCLRQSYRQRSGRK